LNQASKPQEYLDEIPVQIEGENSVAMPDEEAGGRGKRKKTTNRLYNLADFTQHWDNDTSDVDDIE
jgi:hypothetical protein